MESVKPLWKAFEVQSPGSLYQSYVWCQAWMETAGAARGCSPCIVVATDERQQVQFLLPLQHRRHLGIRLLEWLGAPHINYGLGLCHFGFLKAAPRWFEENWESIVAAAGPCDTVLLRDMPEQLNGYDNPMASHFNLKAPNKSYAMDLTSDFDSLQLRKRSSDDRRSARKRESGLSKAGAIGFGLPSGKAELHALLDRMFEQQQDRLAERGVHGVFGPHERAFIHRIADLQDDDKPALAPYTLTCNGEVLAVMLGGIFSGTYWALISSLAASNLRKHSPGDLALRKTIEACCQRGLQRFDFSAGHSRYKESWADEAIQLYTHVGALNLRGLIYAGVITIKLTAKRLVKETPILVTLANRLRQALRGRNS